MTQCYTERPAHHIRKTEMENVYHTAYLGAKIDDKLTGQNTLTRLQQRQLTP